MKNKGFSLFSGLENVLTAVLIFGVLKIENILNWSWVMVFTPLIIYFSFWILILILVVVFVVEKN